MVKSATHCVSTGYILTRVFFWRCIRNYVDVRMDMGITVIHCVLIILITSDDDKSTYIVYRITCGLVSEDKSQPYF